MPAPDPRAPDALLDDVATAVVVGDPEDAAALGALVAPLRGVAVALRDAGDDGTADAAEAAADALAAGLADGSAPAVLHAALSDAVCALQERREGAADAADAAADAADAADAAADAADAGGGGPAFDDETLGLVADFLEEGAEGLATADDILLALEHEGPDAERVHALFRVFHTLKGVAGFLGFAEVAEVAHTTETLLNHVREGRARLEGRPLDAVFAATGCMRELLDAVRAAAQANVALRPVASVPTVGNALRACIAAAERGEVAEVAEVPEVPEAAQAAPAEIDAPADPHPTDEARPAGAPARLRETVKVDLERVDSLLEMIGELIIVESMVVYAPEIAELPSLRVRKHLTQLAKISRDLQDVAMRMRMVPVRGVFQKMGRLVRELARKTGKHATLQLAGESTEMDRSMVERLEEPLVHMLRNAVDHGVETAEARVAAGKPPEATLRLSAYHEGGSVVVEVADDGRGLDRDAILARALERGLVRPGEALSDAEVHNLVFAPGFSTAKAVTDLSGRGVGMDVVKRAIEDLRGRVSIASVPGRGTTFRLVLPLTLAIIDGMLVACGSERYVVPSLCIVESLRPQPWMISTVRGREELVNVRGDLLPLYHLGRLFDVPDAIDDPSRALVVVVESMGRKIGLLVDEVIAQHQVVIKPVGAGLESPELFSGAAILSDGRVGLILNVDRICNAVGVREHRAGWGTQEARP